MQVFKEHSCSTNTLEGIKLQLCYCLYDSFCHKLLEKFSIIKILNVENESKNKMTKYFISYKYWPQKYDHIPCAAVLFFSIIKAKQRRPNLFLSCCH